MSNIINSLTNTQYNAIPSKKLKENEREKQTMVIEAPQSLYKYSVDRAIAEQDEFRRTEKQNAVEAKLKKSAKTPKKAIFIAAFLTGLYLLKKLKKQK